MKRSVFPDTSIKVNYRISIFHDLSFFLYQVWISGNSISDVTLDTADRDINDLKIVSNIMMTTVRCLAFCQGLGFTIAALQVGIHSIKN